MRVHLEGFGSLKERGFFMLVRLFLRMNFYLECSLLKVELMLEIKKIKLRTQNTYKSGSSILKIYFYSSDNHDLI